MDLLEEPSINAREFVNLIDGEACLNGGCNREQPVGRRLPEFGLEIGEFHVIIADQAVHSDVDHPQCFLQGFFEFPANGHHFPYRLHT